MKKIHRILLPSTFLWFILCSSFLAHAQVSVAPTIIFIHDNTNVGEIYVSNSSDQPQEITIRTLFGYPQSDSNGTLSMNYEDETRSTAWGLGNQIRVFPRRLVLLGGQSQVVRLQVLPMRDRTDGVYWARLMVSSTAITPDVGEETSADGIGARFSYVMEQSIPIFYRKGDTTTGITVNDIDVTLLEEQLILLPHMERSGNSPYMGTMTAEVFDASGNKVTSIRQSVYLYFEEWRKLELPLTETMQPGMYRVDIYFDTVRNDIPPTDIVQAPRISFSKTIQL
jgi:hypothetical protein